MSTTLVRVTGTPMERWAVICDGCGNALQFLLDDKPENEIGTEWFDDASAAAKSATNRGWSLEPPDGRDGAYCPMCVDEADAAEESEATS